MNNCSFLGRLTRDVELKSSKDGKTKIATYSIAVKRPFAKTGSQDTDFFNVRALGGAAEFVSKYFSKGKQIDLTGSLQIDRFKVDGVKKEFTYILASGQFFVDSNNNTNDTAPTNDPMYNDSNMEDDDSDLPF